MTLDRIPAVVDTCRVCRMWAKPGPDSNASANMPTEFNQIVEMDIMYYLGKIIFHMLCRCTRWHAAKEIPKNDDETVIEAIYDIWVKVHGSPKLLVGDGGREWEVSLDTNLFFKRRGITVNIRAPRQHARYVERRGALLRHTLHLIDTQLEADWKKCR